MPEGMLKKFQLYPLRGIDRGNNSQPIIGTPVLTVCPKLGPFVLHCLLLSHVQLDT